ncbi:MAG: aminopeptidase [Oscillospiraceae bacterium]|nr:aminopeptidase [Oscillospiraceae bacterium]
MATKKEKTEKSQAALLKEKLFSQKKHAGLRMTEKEIKTAYDYCGKYMDFLGKAKIERDAVEYTIAAAEKKGYIPFEKGMKLKAGDKVYLCNRGKAVIFALIGKKGVKDGIRISAAHIDSPRLDLKQNPVYESDETAYFKTHYYGGIKKYQWPTVPLALHGVIVRADGTQVRVTIGEDESDPVFCVTDLLPHLATDQMKRPSVELVRGEELNILIGSMPFKDDDASERVKLAILSILNEKYGITEDDFISAELDAVPAYKPRDIGFDRSLIGGYGHDDKVCAYTAFSALMDIKKVPERTALVILTDKEETGSDGNTGLKSAYFRYFVDDLAECFGEHGRTVLSRSECLSADVNAAFDPTFPDVLERRNAAFINYGVCVTKFTGARGKSGTSDASAEFVGTVRALLDKNSVVWQTGELGKVDLGGGGTVAAYIANLDVDTIDVGVPVLCMHAPFEIVAKTDVYMTYKAFSVFMAQ